MKGKEKDLEWWEQPDAPTEEKPTQDALLKQIERMRIAQKGIPKALLLKQVLAFFFIVINGALAYSSIGSPLGIWVYLFTIPIILILFDYLFMLRTLKKMAVDET